MGVTIMLVMQVFLGFTLISITIMLDQWFGISVKLGSYIGVLGLPVYIIAFTCACAIGRREGFIKPRQMETLRRIPGPLPAASFETLELRTPDSLRKQVMLICPAVGCLIAILALLCDTNHTRILGFAVSGLFFAFGLFLFWRGKSEDLDLVTRIDRDGITASQGFRRRSAAWQEIEVVEIATLSGAPGAPVTRTYTLFGQNAKRLFVFSLLFVPPTEQEEFVRALREAFEAQANASEMTV